MMKLRTLLLAPALASGILASAQGNQNWTATDINGVQHSIQSYLQDGKTVLVDISAHWCGPCWAWHKSHIMDKLWAEFGPEGTDDLVIIWVDGSSNPQSTMALLQGATGSQGNWIEGTEFPMIGPNGQGNMLRQAYGTTAFPTLYMHCPGAPAGVEISRQATWQQFFNSWRNSCPAPFNHGANDATLLQLDNSVLCPGEGPVAELYNVGSSSLSSATVKLMDGGTTLQTVNWTGNLSPWTSTMVAFDQVNITGPVTYTAEVSNPNGSADANPAGNMEDYDYDLAPTAALATVHLELRTDNYASETTWKLFDGNNNIVAQDPAGNYANNTTYNYWWNLNPNECYRFEISDSYGDGICCSYGNGFYRLRSNGVIVSEGGQFGGIDKAPFKTGAAVGIEENMLESGLNIFPNPTDGMLNIGFELPSSMVLNITVMNVVGEVVAQQGKGFGPGSQVATLDLSGLANGTYYVNLLAEGMTATRKVVITR